MTNAVAALLQSDLRPAETVFKYSLVLSGEKKLALKIHMQGCLLWVK